MEIPNILKKEFKRLYEGLELNVWSFAIASEYIDRFDCRLYSPEDYFDDYVAASDKYRGSISRNIICFVADEDKDSWSLWSSESQEFKFLILDLDKDLLIEIATPAIESTSASLATRKKNAQYTTDSIRTLKLDRELNQLYETDTDSEVLLLLKLM